MTILEALSATGLRSIRYANEVKGIKSIVANDLSQQAVNAIEENIQKNNMGHMITANKADAS